MQQLATEMYKVHHRLSPDIMNDIFFKKNVWNAILEIIFHLQQKMLNLLIMDQKLYYI